MCFLYWYTVQPQPTIDAFFPSEGSLKLKFLEGGVASDDGRAVAMV